MSNSESATEKLERISRHFVFTDEAAARRYLDDVAQDGFHPAAPHVGGICPQSSYRGDERVTTWLVAVEKQTYNGTTTPAYHEGDRVLAHVHQSDWQPVEGTVAKVDGHSLTVRLDTPNPNRVATVECLDYEVSPVAP